MAGFVCTVRGRSRFYHSFSGVIGPDFARLGIGGRFYRVAGVLKGRGDASSLPIHVDADKSVFVTAVTAWRAAVKPSVSIVVARTAPGVELDRAAAAMESWFRGRDPRMKLKVNSPKYLIAQMETQLALMTLLLGAVGSISLVVGGIGVMNVMLISVAERRREIGVRRALGASRGDIRGQFLIESLILTLAGGLVGLAAGTGVTWGICEYTGWEFFVSTLSAAVGLGVSSTVGIFFGLQPAHQAARLDPIVALQGE